MEQPRHHEGRLAVLQAQVAYSERVKQVMNQIHAAKDLDHLFVELCDDVLSLFDAEHLTLYAIDYENKEIYSRFLDLNEMKEIRVALNDRSIAGFVARHRKMVNIADAYDTAELARISPTLSFDSSWDKRTGIRTKQMLTAPLWAQSTGLTGVLQLINKKSAPHFTPEDVAKVREIAQTLSIAFHNQYQLAKRKPAKFDALVAAHLISQIELDAATIEARERQRPIESVLMEKYQLDKQHIGQALSAFYKCPFVDWGAYTTIAPDLVQGINPSYLKANYWIPLRMTEDKVEVVIDNPFALHKLQDIKRLFPFREVKCFVGLQEDILRFVNAVSAGLDSHASTNSIATILGQLESEGQDTDKKDAPRDQVIDENASAIVRLVNQIIIDAYKKGASDIHIEPYGEQRETMVRFRVDGNCDVSFEVPPAYRRALTSRLKVMARLDIAERRKPQDGKIKFRLPDREIELRVATIPTAGTDNEDVVMRILTSSELIPLDELYMSDRNLREFQRLLRMPYGMLLCVGPTGSGKTTTLHAALGFLNALDIKIWTAEDPVEITQYGLRQVQVHPKIGFTFAAAMRAFLRADPDVIMVGEIRDRETAEVSIEASLTGHLMLSTLHTNSAAETVTRLLEMGMDPFNFADALLGVLAQRLARTICQHCKEWYHPTKEEYDALAYGYGEAAFATLGIRYDDHFVLWRGKGCEACRQTGYKGRIGLHELLIATEEIKTLIHTRAPVTELFRAAVAQGMTTLVQDGIRKCLQGWTDYSQIKAVAMR